MVFVAIYYQFITGLSGGKNNLEMLGSMECDTFATILHCFVLFLLYKKIAMGVSTYPFHSFLWY